MNIIDITLGVFVGGLLVYLFFNKQIQRYRSEKIHLEVTLDEKIKSYENQIDLIKVAKEQMSKDFKEVASEILEKDRDNLH